MDEGKVTPRGRLGQPFECRPNSSQGCPGFSLAKREVAFPFGQRQSGSHGSLSSGRSPSCWVQTGPIRGEGCQSCCAGGRYTGGSLAGGMDDAFDDIYALRERHRHSVLTFIVGGLGENAAAGKIAWKHTGHGGINQIVGHIR